MKKSILIIALTALLTIVLTGKAMAKDVWGNETAWDTSTTGFLLETAVHDQPQIFENTSVYCPSLTARVFGLVEKITCHKLDRFVGCRARLEFSLQSLFSLPGKGDLTPRLTIKFAL